jgi:hypothetical protein
MARKVITQGDPNDVASSNIDKNFIELYAEDATLQNNIDTVAGNVTGLSLAGRPFSYTAKLVATAGATPVVLVPASVVATAEKIYLRGFLLNVSGSTPWTDVTATQLVIADTNSSAKSALTIAKAGLIANAVIDSFADANTVASTYVLLNTGFTAGKGLSMATDANFTAGSDIYVTVWGYIK